MINGFLNLHKNVNLRTTATMTWNKYIGTILIVAGTTIGASMLALPLKTAEIGLPMGLLFMAVAWLFMLINALVILKALAPYPAEATFHTLVKRTFGRPGAVVMAIAMLWLFYALLAAYASGASQLLQQVTGVPAKALGVMIFIGFGGVILTHTGLTDYANRLLFLIKLVVFVAVAVPMMQLISVADLQASMRQPFSQISDSGASVAVLLIYITSFGFHGSIPSLVAYNNGQNSALKRAFFWGTLLSVVLYCFWIALCLGLAGQTPAALKDMATMIRFLGLQTGVAWIEISLNMFALFAVLTSFIGVGLGLSDYFRDMLKKGTKEAHIAWVGLYTFGPPLLVMLYNDQLFVQALEFAGVALVFIAVLVPNMILQLQRLRQIQRVSMGMTLVSGLMIFAALALIPLYFFGSF